MIGRRAVRQSEPATVGDSNGLSLSDEHALRSILQNAESMQPCRAYMGGKERDELDALVRDVTLRLKPPSVSDLTERADAYFGTLANQFDWASVRLMPANGLRTND